MAEGIAEKLRLSEENRRGLWAALRMIREAIEIQAPPGAVKAREETGAEPMGEAEAIVAGILALSGELDSIQGRLKAAESALVALDSGKTSAYWRDHPQS